ncbi:MAG: hypothetical protein M5U34_26780 [Chloroflexi bacterium]|nr:hypothetical protein [Chloroflexota bacterium]
MRSSPMARSAKQKARLQRVAEMQKLSFDRRENQVAISLAGRRLGKQVLEARNLSKSFGDLTLFQKLDFDLNPRRPHRHSWPKWRWQKHLAQCVGRQTTAGQRAHRLG